MNRFSIACFLALEPLACGTADAQPTEAQRALEALEEVEAASRAEALTATTADMASAFTLGATVELSAYDLQKRYTAVSPCAGVSVEGATLTVEYGAKAGDCVFRGHELSGTVRVSISSQGAEGVVVEHEWLELSNGFVSLNGTATVTWDLAQTRHVSHEMRWTSLASGRTAQGQGDRSQLRVGVNGSVSMIRIDGSRSWRSERGDWALDFDAANLRWAASMPEEGTYTLVTPTQETFSMRFARLNEDTTRVGVISGEFEYQDQEPEFAFTVSQLGVIEREPR